MLEIYKNYSKIMKKTTFLIVGKHAVLEALKNPSRKVERVFLTDDAQKRLNRENQSLNLFGSVSVFYKSKRELAFVTQTTLSVDDTKEIISALKKKFPEIREPKKEDICYATTNRQAAVKKIAKECDMFFVIGSRNSSNSLRLVEVAKNSGCTNSRLIHSESDVPFEEIEKYKTIGISSGASAPEILVDNFINNLKKKFVISMEEVRIVKENITFKIPGKLN